MRKLLCFFCVLLLGFGMLGVAHATLIDQGGGLIYDDVLEITWLQNANLAATQTFGVSGISSLGYMDWYTAQDWISAMNSDNYLGYSDWRLPDAHNQDGSGPDTGYNVTGSEMGHMFYNNLGGTVDSFCGATFEDGATSETKSFQKLQDSYYWSGTEWVFFFDLGYQYEDLGWRYGFAWAVRPGNSAPVPEPATMLLLGTGLAGLGVFRKRRRSHG